MDERQRSQRVQKNREWVKAGEGGKDSCWARTRPYAKKIIRWGEEKKRIGKF